MSAMSTPAAMHSWVTSHPPEWQDPYSQRRTLRRVYGQLTAVARQARPA